VKNLPCLSAFFSTGDSEDSLLQSVVISGGRDRACNSIVLSNPLLLGIVLKKSTILGLSRKAWITEIQTPFKLRISPESPANGSVGEWVAHRSVGM
jgi:hypothetical protein